MSFIDSIINIFLVFAALILIVPIIRGAPFVPTSRKVVEQIFKLATVKKGDKVADIGAGNGRLVVAFAEAGIEAHGYEINPLLVWWGRSRIKKAGLGDKAFLHWKNFWSVDYSTFSVVTVFGITYIMKALEDKLQKELKIGTKVISNAFAFPTWKLKAQDGSARLYIKE
ncbi:class I SAM-dependent methyltransferase [Candidatus Jorgensenbacteria bacterium]|nr:class I SAM-dependent methyltransferase [Candidatus Jorgensenbacteria bacterium]